MKKKFYKSATGIKFWIEKLGETIWVHRNGRTFSIKHNQLQPTYEKQPSTQFTSQLKAPFPGRITSIKVKQNDCITAHQHLMVIESMKMEHTLSIPHSAKIQSILTEEGQTVAFGQKIMTFVPVSKNESSNEEN